MTEATPYQLMARVRAVSELVDAAKADVLRLKTHDAAIILQREQRRLAEARAALPPLRLVVSQ